MYCTIVFQDMIFQHYKKSYLPDGDLARGELICCLSGSLFGEVPRLDFLGDLCSELFLAAFIVDSSGVFPSVLLRFPPLLDEFSLEG